MRGNDWSAGTYVCLFVTGGAALYGLTHPDHWTAFPIHCLTPLGALISSNYPLWAAAVAAFMLYNVPFIVFAAFFYRDPVEQIQRKAERLAGRMQRFAKVAADTREMVQKFGRK